MRKRVRRKLSPEAKLGAWAIGQSVLRNGETDLYALEYEDGDQEEVVTEEYKLGRDRWIQEWGSKPDEIAEPCDSKPGTHKKATKLSKAARDRIEEVIDLTAT